MKIAVEKIKDKTIEIEEDIPAFSWEMDSSDVKFVSNIHISCKVERIHKEIIVDVGLIIRREIICSRCLNQVCQIVRQEFRKSYNMDKLGNYLDIEKDIREEVLLNFPMKVLCSPDCKGICSGCGVNLNYKKCKC